MILKQKAISPVLMWLIVAAGFFFAFRMLPATLVFPRIPTVSWVVLLAAAYWSYFFIGALKVHRKAALSAEKIRKIVKEGVYSKVRHPIYSADIVFAWSIFLSYPDVRLLVGVSWLTLILLFWMDREEKALSEKFGPEYSKYKDQVPKIIPKFK